MSQTLLKILADFTVQLSAPVAVGDTTATLTSATDDDGVALPTGLYGFTIDAGQSNKEYITCTLTGTALTNIKSISRQGAETTGFARAHRRGAKVTVTDWAILSRMFKNLNGDTGFNSSAPLFYDGTANITTANQFATKAYVDGVAISGAGNADTSTQGLVQMATQSQVDNGTTQGSSGAYLVSPLDLIRAKKYHDYAADAGGTDAYAITVTPAITAYATGQEFTFKAGTANTGPCTLNVNGVGAVTIKKNVSQDLATGDILADQIIKVVYTASATFQLVSHFENNSAIKFGGTGEDGALSVPSGTTTINLGGVNVFVKNYTSINIASGATLNFSNPHANGTIIILKSIGDVVIAGTINASGMGGAQGTNGFGLFGSENMSGGSGSTSTAAGGVAITTFRQFYTKTADKLYQRIIGLHTGAGGGGGQAGDAPDNAPGGAGGRGGGAVYIECRGSLNFSGTINTSGLSGNNGTNGVTNSGGGGGGGGGSAGAIVVLYNALTANTGTLTSTGGNGGSGGDGNGGDISLTSGGGGGAGSFTAAGGGATAGAGNNAAGAGAGGAGGRGQASGSGYAGGSGGATESGLVAKNIYLP